MKRMIMTVFVRELIRPDSFLVVAHNFANLFRLTISCEQTNQTPEKSQLDIGLFFYYAASN